MKSDSGCKFNLNQTVTDSLKHCLLIKVLELQFVTPKNELLKTQKYKFVFKYFITINNEKQVQKSLKSDFIMIKSAVQLKKK